MTVASLELCKQLYELSGWIDTGYAWYSTSHRDDNDVWEEGAPVSKSRLHHQSVWQPSGIGHSYGEGRLPICMAYDLGFLLRELPESIETGYDVKAWLTMDNLGGDGWQFCYRPGKALPLFVNIDNTPENALCKLAIELFKQGILKPESEG